MKHKTTWLKKSEKKNSVSVSFKRLNLSLGDYLSTINDLKIVDKEIKQAR